MNSVGLAALGLIGLIAVSPPAAAAVSPAPRLAAGGAAAELVRNEISPAQERALWEEVRRNVADLRRRDAVAAPDAAVTYAFPLRLAPGLPDHAGFRVSASRTR